MTIHFYTRTDEYGEFCNFSNHGIVMDGLYWPPVVHYFQAQKFPGSELQERIRNARTPGDAKTYGRTKSVRLRDDWEIVKEEVMYRAVLCKFKTHAQFRQRLLDTGNQEIVENAPSDYFWGCGANGTGKNKLGEILMRVRSELA